MYRIALTMVALLAAALIFSGCTRYVVRDGNGNQVGKVESVWGAQPMARVSITDMQGNDRTVALRFVPDQILNGGGSANAGGPGINPVGGPGVYFDQPYCAGNAFIHPSSGFLPAFVPSAVIPDANGTPQLYVADSDTTQQVTVVTGLFITDTGTGPSSACQFFAPETADLLPVSLVVNDLTALYPPPYSLEIVQ